METSESPEAEAQQLAVESLMTTTRPGDRLILTTFGNTRWKKLRVNSQQGLQVQWYHLSQGKMTQALMETGQHLTADASSYVVVIADSQNPTTLLSTRALRALPPQASVRLIGLALDPTWTAFNPLLNRRDVKVLAHESLAHTTAALIRELHHRRGYVPTWATWGIAGGEMLGIMMCLLISYWRKQRKIEVLLEQDEKEDYQLLDLRDHEEVQLGKAILRREGGNLHLIMDQEQRRLMRGDEVEVRDEEGKVIRVTAPPTTGRHGRHRFRPFIFRGRNRGG